MLSKDRGIEHRVAQIPEVILSTDQVPRWINQLGNFYGVDPYLLFEGTPQIPHEFARYLLPVHIDEVVGRVHLSVRHLTQEKVPFFTVDIAFSTGGHPESLYKPHITKMYLDESIQSVIFSSDKMGTSVSLSRNGEYEARNFPEVSMNELRKLHNEALRIPHRGLEDETLDLDSDSLFQRVENYSLLENSSLARWQYKQTLDRILLTGQKTDEPEHSAQAEFDHDLTGQMDRPQSAEMSDPFADELLDEIIAKQRIFRYKGRVFGPFPLSLFKKRGEDDNISAT